MSVYTAILFLLSTFAGKHHYSPISSHVSLPIMDSTLCNGFDFPVGDKNAAGWISTSKWGDSTQQEICTGQKWNVKPGTRSSNNAVYAIGSGKVIFAKKHPSPFGNIILIEHRYAENGKVKTIYSRYACLAQINVKQGDLVFRRQEIGMASSELNPDFKTQVYVEIRKSTLEGYEEGFNPILNGKNAIWVKENYEDCSSFIKNHRNILLPFQKSKLVMVVKNKFKCYLFEKGKLKKTYEIALSQEPVGAKEKQGDLKVPEGEYSICEKTKGPFSTTTNWANAYLGTRWLCLTYPNTFDAARGLEKNEITKDQYMKIAQATKAGIKPPQSTALGGAVGIHGWIEEDWSNESSRAQTWGCVSFHNKDLNEFYDLVDLKTTVIIIP
ncbi:MAG TPA: L,D-transpeptidase family protein [Flavobacteriales bacterium]|nr:L,D-transpeptidase family protein [Flavobacteriales bacterium]